MRTELHLGEEETLIEKGKKLYIYKEEASVAVFPHNFIRDEATLQCAKSVCK